MNAPSFDFTAPPDLSMFYGLREQLQRQESSTNISYLDFIQLKIYLKKPSYQMV